MVEAVSAAGLCLPDPGGLCLSLPDGMKAERAAVATPPRLTWSSLREIETGAMELSQNMRGASGAINCSS